MAISVVINTYNSSRLLAKTLETVSDFDEIIVCDMESTDDTVEIARRHGARVVTFPKGNYDHCEPARNYAISQARYEWVFVVDSDELVPDDLRKFLYKFTVKASKDTTLKGLYIPRKNFVIDRFRKSKYPDYKLRFFAKDSVNWPPEIHSVPEIDGRVSKIPGSKQNMALVHVPPTINEMIDRINRVSTVEMEKNRGKKITYFHVLMIPACRFFDSYFLKGAFRTGVAGLIISVNNAVGDFYRLAKIYESNVRRHIASGSFGDLPDTIVEEKLRLLEEEETRIKMFEQSMHRKDNLSIE